MFSADFVQSMRRKWLPVSVLLSVSVILCELQFEWFQKGILVDNNGNIEPKYILMLNHPMEYYRKHSNFSVCRVRSNCIWTWNRTFFGEGNESMFDAVVVNPYQAKNTEAAKALTEFPRHRKQRFIMRHNESPQVKDGYINQQYLSRNFFNWTWTYYAKSDIIASYVPLFQEAYHPEPPGPFWHGPIFYNSSNVNVIDKKLFKKKLVFWVVSHCQTQSEREKYVSVLKKYIPVDIYGRCGKYKYCPRARREKNTVFKQENMDKEERCFEQLASQYKFYISFENSLCDEYVTEKLTRALESNLVPIVMGGVDYKRIAPPNSFINVDDFPTVKALADYLRYLDRNETAYLKYFEWKQTHVGYERLDLCELCYKLNDINEPESTYSNMFSWFYYAQNSLKPACHPPSEKKYYANMFEEFKQLKVNHKIG